MTGANAIVEAVEKARKAAGITQAAMAATVGMTQGHYSKVASGKVPAGRKAVDAFSAWLEHRATPIAASGARQLELKRLATAIAMQCIELARLAVEE